MSETREDMLYQICPICKGSGKLPRDPQGFTRDCYCTPLRVVAVGVTAGQLDRMARRETIEAEQRAGFDRATGTITKAGHPAKLDAISSEPETTDLKIGECVLTKSGEKAWVHRIVGQQIFLSFEGYACSGKRFPSQAPYGIEDLEVPQKDGE